MWNHSLAINIKIGVVCGPRFETAVDPFEEQNVVSVITRHVIPSALLALHTAEPEVFARMRELAPDVEDCAKVVKFVGIKLEEFSCSDKRVKGLEWTTRAELVEEESGEALLYVECNVVGDDNVSLVQDTPKVLH